MISDPFCDQEESLIDPNVPKNRLYQNEEGEVFLRPKPPGEVLGEKVLLPIIEWTGHFFSSLGETAYEVRTSLQKTYTFFTFPLSLPNIFPVVAAQMIEEPLIEDPFSGSHLRFKRFCMKQI